MDFLHTAIHILGKFGRLFRYAQRHRSEDEGLPVWEDRFYDDLLAELHLAYGESRALLLDEIQNLPRWELFVSRLHRAGYNLVLTGSNARLLGREMATALTGRHIPLEILPFDFPEFLRARQFDPTSGRTGFPDAQAIFQGLVEKFQSGCGPPGRSTWWRNWSRWRIPWRVKTPGNASSKPLSKRRRNWGRTG